MRSVHVTALSERAAARRGGSSTRKRREHREARARSRGGRRSSARCSICRTAPGPPRPAHAGTHQEGGRFLSTARRQLAPNRTSRLQTLHLPPELDIRGEIRAPGRHLGRDHRRARLSAAGAAPARRAAGGDGAAREHHQDRRHAHGAGERRRTARSAHGRVPERRDAARHRTPARRGRRLRGPRRRRSPMGTGTARQGPHDHHHPPEGASPTRASCRSPGRPSPRPSKAYFERSEQIPTRLAGAAGEGKAGLLIKALPPEMATARPRSCTARGGGLHAPVDARRHPRRGRAARDRQRNAPAPAVPRGDRSPAASRGLAFRCTCSRERTREALRTLPREELQAILDEDGFVEMDCQFCPAVYRFDAIDLELVFAPEAGAGEEAHSGTRQGDRSEGATDGRPGGTRRPPARPLAPAPMRSGIIRGPSRHPAASARR